MGNFAAVMPRATIQGLGNLPSSQQPPPQTAANTVSWEDLKARNDAQMASQNPYQTLTQGIAGATQFTPKTNLNLGAMPDTNNFQPNPQIERIRPVMPSQVGQMAGQSGQFSPQALSQGLQQQQAAQNMMQGMTNRPPQGQVPMSMQRQPEGGMAGRNMPPMGRRPRF